jgi:glucose/mannose-6-phosphate isomerase
VIDLDDESALRAGDPGRMLDAIAGMAGHVRAGYRLGRDARGLPSGEGVSAIVVCGMGSSAACGDLIRALFANRIRVPVLVVRTPELPELVGPHTLVLASSYSGNTAESLTAFEEALRRGARVFGVTSGGELARRCAELDLACVTVPTGFMPRAAIGFMALGGLGALEATGLAPALGADVEEAGRELEASLSLCAPGVPVSANPAKTVAAAAADRTPVVWGSEGIGAVAAARWKSELNENAKVPAFWSELPELDHNEIVGWSEGAGRRFLVIALRHAGEHPDVAARFEPSVALARGSGAEVKELWARGTSALARFFSLVVVGDLTATYLGLARRVDPTPIDAIARLKRSPAEA